MFCSVPPFLVHILRLQEGGKTQWFVLRADLYLVEKLIGWTLARSCWIKGSERESLFLRSYSFMGSNPFGSRGADDLSRSDSLGLKNGNGAVNLYLQLSAVNLLMNTVLGLHTSIYHRSFLIITFGPHVSWKQTVRCKSKVLKWYILMQQHLTGYCSLRIMFDM